MYHIIIFCSSHPELTRLVSRKAGVKPGDVVLQKFANKECRVLLQEHVRVRILIIDVDTKGLSRKLSDIYKDIKYFIRNI